MGNRRSPRGLVIFDLDGTLVDSRADLAAAVNASLVELGRPPLPVDEIERFIGHGVTRLLERALGGAEAGARARPVFHRHYESCLLDRTRPYPGIDALVRELGEGRKLAVATNKPGPWARSIVDGLGWSQAIPYVVGGGDVERLKPAPDMADLLMERSGAQAASTIVVGDMDVDLELARAAGVRFVGVSWGLGGRAQLTGAGAELVVDSAAELEQVLEHATG
ncbi:MAG TPA: HAD hydrolase-like protein [Chondromyces sp.]|nr:HAD hydrolase-like protein [Chondromyces sp.]